MPSARTIVMNALISLVAILIAVLVLEFAVRLFNLAPLSEASQVGGGLKTILQFDPVLETRYVPNSETRIISPYGEFDITYHINNLGLRDSDVTKKPKNEFRVLFVGNSFVEGWGVNKENEFVRIAESALDKQRDISETKRVRLVNAGISAYGAAQSYLQAKAIWNIVDPDMVILVLVGTMVNADYAYLKQARFDLNGIAQGLSADAVLSGGAPAAFDSNSVNPLVTRFAHYSAIVRLVAERMANRRAMDRIKVGDPETDMLAAYRSDAEMLQMMYEPTLKHANALAQLARQYGKPFLLVHLPMAFEVSGTEWDIGRRAYHMDSRVYDNKEDIMVRNFCTVQAIECLFADDLIRTEVQRSADNPIYFRYDFHFTPTGNRLIGNWLGEQLGATVTRSSTN
jgi:hypothetical protein